MFSRPPFDDDGSFRAWLARDAEIRPPEALYERVLEATMATHRRWGWLVIERWFPMQMTARFGSVPRAVVVLVLLAALLGVAGAVQVASAPTHRPSGAGAFSPASPLTVGRASHTATLLPDGRVLVTGGYEDSSSAEVRHPADGVFRPTPRELVVPRRYHTATMLDNERVLLLGGQDAPSAEVWDPQTESFVALGPLAEYRSNHTATLLADGRVLIIGGYDGPAGADLFDPDRVRRTPAGSLAHPRGHHSAALLSDGRVLVVGGPVEAELWDPETTGFSAAGSLAQPRWWGTATTLPDDRVLVIGGFAGEAFGESDEPVATAELWDPTTKAFEPAGTLLEARGHHTATLLHDGRVLVVGGGGGPDAPTRSAELWDPRTQTFSAADPLDEARGGHTATLLPDHRVLVIGGYGRGDVPLTSTEIWDPTPDATGVRWTLESTGRDWPGPLRPEPEDGAPVVAGERSRGGNGNPVELGYTDALAEEAVAEFPWVDITEMQQDGRSAGFDLADWPAPIDPSERWMAYGIVLDRDLDGVPDVRMGIDNAPGGVHRFWRTDLATGETIAQTGPPYDRSDHLPSTYFPGDSDVHSHAGFRDAFSYDRFAGSQYRFRFYFWASQVEDGRIVATDYAPDAGWIETRS